MNVGGTRFPTKRVKITSTPAGQTPHYTYIASEGNCVELDEEDLRSAVAWLVEYLRIHDNVTREFKERERERSEEAARQLDDGAGVDGSGY